MEKGNTFSSFIQKIDEAKETGKAFGGILIDASIGEDADKGTLRAGFAWCSPS